MNRFPSLTQFAFRATWVSLVMIFGSLLAGCHAQAPSGKTSSQSATPAGSSGVAAALRDKPPVVEPPAPSRPLTPAGKIELFDGKSLTGWKISDFAGTGAVKVEQNFKGDLPAILLEQGVMTGITWTNEIPRMNYEITLEAMRVMGGDFFCGLTFPVGKDPCSFIVGGWGGAVVGLSSVDGEDAAHNETAKYMKFDEGRWYRIRLRVTESAIQAWIDDEQVVNLVTTDRTLSIRLEVEGSKPLGISTWSTAGAIRKLRFVRLN